MRITSTGSVAIGATDPGAYKLYVNGATNVQTGDLIITSGNLRVGEASAVSASSIGEFSGATDSGLSLVSRSNPGTTVEEEYLAGFGYTSTGAMQKKGSLSWHWEDATNANGYASLWLGASYMVAGVQTDDEALRLYGNHGASFFRTNRTAPGAGILDVNGIITTTGNVGIGTVAPSSTLHISNVSSTVEIGASSTTGYGCLKMHAASGTVGAAIYVYFDSNAVIFATTTKPAFCM